MKNMRPADHREEKIRPASVAGVFYPADPGELARMIREDGMRGMTSNPTIFEKAISSSADYDASLKKAALKYSSPEAIFEAIAIEDIQKAGYQTGTGVMIGLPFQTIENLADDLLFIKRMDIDMVGMGPYIEHEDTPLYAFRNLLMPKEDRFKLSLKMVAILRILMKDINIAATTAMQAIDKLGREKALKVGANILMPNLTPLQYREGYLLYEDKPCIDEEAEQCKTCLEARIHLAGDDIGFGEWGDSKHFTKRKNELL